MFRRAVQFLGEVRTELGKASWPWDVKEKGARRFRELIDSTSVVVIAMLLLSGYIAFWDFIMVRVVSWLVP
jgi:preprotein translocase subunit SecE